jgi:hypothetical protein
MLIKEMRILHLEGFMNMPARKIYISYSGYFIGDVKNLFWRHKEFIGDMKISLRRFFFEDKWSHRLREGFIILL